VNEIEVLALPDANVPLLRKVVEWVEGESEKPYVDREWYQGHYFTSKMGWSCGTKACVAGKIALDAGWDPVFDGAYSTDIVEKDGELSTAFEVACVELGITFPYANALFAATNTAGTVRNIAEKISGEKL